MVIIRELSHTEKLCFNMERLSNQHFNKHSTSNVNKSDNSKANCKACLKIGNIKIHHDFPTCAYASDKLRGSSPENFKGWLQIFCAPKFVDEYMKNQYSKDKKTLQPGWKSKEPKSEDTSKPKSDSNKKYHSRDSQKSKTDSNQKGEQAAKTELLYEDENSRGKRWCHSLLFDGKCSDSECNYSHPKLCHSWERDQKCNYNPCNRFHRNCAGQNDSNNRNKPQNQNHQNRQSATKGQNKQYKQKDNKKQTGVAKTLNSTSETETKCLWNCKEANKHATWNCEQFNIKTMTLVQFWVALKQRNSEYAEKRKHDYQTVFTFLIKKRSECDDLISKNLETQNKQTASAFTASNYDYSPSSERKTEEEDLIDLREHPTYMI